jgi:hypothetical protein
MRTTLLSVLVVGLLLSPPAQAASCTTALQDRFEVAMNRMQNFARMAARATAMREAQDVSNLCAATRELPALVQLAEEYYPACDPIAGQREIPAARNLASRAAVFAKEKCQVQPQRRR